MTDLITLDWETFYSKEFTLSKMTVQEYVLSPHFEVIMIAVKVNDGDIEWFTGTHEQIRAWLQKFNWDNAIAIAHNAMFDGAIMEWIFDIHPKQWFCTMMAARPLCAPFTPHGRVNLKFVATYLGFGEKGTEIHNSIGLRRRDFSEQRMQAYAEYCMQDVNLCYKIAKWEMDRLPQSEIMLIHETIRKYVRPQIYIEPELLMMRLAWLRDDKAQILADAGLTDNKMLMSNPQFAAALIELGVDPPTKISPTTGKETYAFAKSDPAFKELLNHEDARVQTLVAARMKHKTTLEETRLQRFIRLGQMTDEDGDPYMLGIPLLYYGAHTGRFSGMDKLNFQNLPRGGELRQALVAPEGYKIVAGDLSQIEARITAALANETELLTLFATGGDPYCAFASRVFAREITKADTTERFIGKMCILGLGFGMGAEKYKTSVKAAGDVDITDNEAYRTVKLYRNTYKHIAGVWRAADFAIQHMSNPNGFYQIGPVTFTHEKAQLPNGMVINYPDLRISEGGGYIYTYRGRTKTIWGGALVENIVQALARIVVSTAELRLASRGLHALMQVHDELVYCVPEQHVDKVDQALTMALIADVPWLPQLPVDCEVSWGDNYKECK